MGRGTKSTVFLMECMADALIRLMGEKPFEKISINEITAEAGVGRSTWFRNFADKSDALTFKLIRLWERWADEHDIQIYDRYEIENARDFFAFNFEYRSILKTIYAANMQSSVYNAFYRIMVLSHDTNTEERYSARFYSYGLFGLLDEWISRDYAESVDKLVEIVKQLADKQITSNNMRF